MSQTATDPKVVGSIFFNGGELDLWIEENLKTVMLSVEEPWLNKPVYKQICLALNRDGFVAIIPEFNLVDAARLMNSFFDMYEKASNITTIINLELCGGIQVLLSDSVKHPVPDHVRVSNKTNDKQQRDEQNEG
jgi:hypothetical protein